MVAGGGVGSGGFDGDENDEDSSEDGEGETENGWQTDDVVVRALAAYENVELDVGKEEVGMIDQGRWCKLSRTLNPQP